MRALVWLLLTVALLAGPARAQFDMTGSWTVHVVDIDVPFDFVQTGDALHHHPPPSHATLNDEESS